MHCRARRERRLTTSTMNGRGNEPMERLYFDDIYVSPSLPNSGRINPFLVVERFDCSATFL